MEFGIALFSFIQDFIRFLLGNISSIPFTISFGAAVLLTMMYFANFVSDILLKMLVVPMWVFVIITYFFPTFLPKEYEFVSLAIFVVMMGITFVLIKRYRKVREKTRKYKAASEVVTWMKATQLLRSRKKIDEQDIKNKITDILEKYKLD